MQDVKKKLAKILYCGGTKLKKQNQRMCTTF